MTRRAGVSLLPFTRSVAQCLREAGVYEHHSGRLVVLTEGAGPHGGSPLRWEHARRDGDGHLVDGTISFHTLRDAVLDLDRRLRDKPTPHACPECGSTSHFDARAAV